jgi:hypothetical protein
MLKHILNNARTGNKLFTVYCLLFKTEMAPNHQQQQAAAAAAVRIPNFLVALVAQCVKGLLPR